MARLASTDFEAFNAYHHRLMIRMTDKNGYRSLEFVGEYFDSGKRFEQNQPGVTSKALDKPYHREQSIYHYFCNRSHAITGVSGGMMYKYNDVFLYIGFSYPLAGCMKSFVELTYGEKSAQYAYDQIYDGEEKTDHCQGWEVKASFEEMSDNVVLNITLGKAGSF